MAIESKHSFSYGGVDASNYNTYVVSIDVDKGGAIDYQLVARGLVGDIGRVKHVGALTIRIRCVVFADNIVDLTTNIDSLLRMLNPTHGERALILGAMSGDVLGSSARKYICVLSEAPRVHIDSPTTATLDLTFTCARGFAEALNASQAQQTVSSGNNTFYISGVGGSVDTAPVYTYVHSGTTASSITLKNVTLNESLTYSLGLVSSYRLKIDVDAGIVWRSEDGGLSWTYSNRYLSSASVFPHLVPGSNEMYMYLSAGSGTLTIDYTARYA